MNEPQWYIWFRRLYKYNMNIEYDWLKYFIRETHNNQIYKIEFNEWPEDNFSTFYVSIFVYDNDADNLKELVESNKITGKSPLFSAFWFKRAFLHIEKEILSNYEHGKIQINYHENRRWHAYWSVLKKYGYVQGENSIEKSW